MDRIKKRSLCPISSALDIFGDKWSLLIIRDILFYNKNSYGEFLQSAEKMATNILADRLAMLEEAKLIVKEQDPQNKRKFIYKPTQKAIDLLPVFVELYMWSHKYEKISPDSKGFIDEIKKDKEGFIKKLSMSLKVKYIS